MACKEIVGDLYYIFPSTARQKRWEDADQDVPERTVKFVQQAVNHLLKNDHFLSAVDDSEEVGHHLCFTFTFRLTYLSRTAVSKTPYSHPAIPASNIVPPVWKENRHRHCESGEHRILQADVF